jgi:hypothetical protein
MASSGGALLYFAAEGMTKKEVDAAVLTYGSGTYLVRQKGKEVRFKVVFMG